MQNVLAKMIDTVVSLFETFSGSTNNMGKAGLGVGGLGLSAMVLQRMLLSPETEKAICDIMPEGRDQNGLQGLTTDNKMYQPTESDFRGWRNEINIKMDKELNKMGLDKNAAKLFKQRTGNLAFQIDRLCRKYTDPIIRNQKISNLIDREINHAMALVQQQPNTSQPERADILTERLTLEDKVRESGNFTGGMKEQPAFFNGITSSNAIPVWVPDLAVARLSSSSVEMDRFHQSQMEAIEKSTRQASEKLTVQSIEEGVRKGLFTADDLLRKGTDMYFDGDKLLLSRMGLESKYDEYKSSLLLNNTSKADRLWNEMRTGTMEFIREIRGEGSNVLNQELAMQEKMGQQTGMGFGLKL